MVGVKLAFRQSYSIDLQMSPEVIADIIEIDNLSLYIRNILVSKEKEEQII